MNNLVDDDIGAQLYTLPFNFVIDSLNVDLICLICGNLLHEAYQTICNCKYCRNCILSYLNNGNQYCTGGKEECRDVALVFDTNVFRNEELIQKVMRVILNCRNSPCDFSGSNETQMVEHLRVCNHRPTECPYSSIGCVNVKVNEDMLETHFQRDTLKHSLLIVEVIDNLKNEVGVLKKELRMSKLEISSLQEERQIREGQMRTHQEERDNLTVMVQNLRRETTELRENVNFLEAVIATPDNERRQTDLENEVVTLRREIRAEREESRNVKNEVETLKKELRTAIMELSKARWHGVGELMKVADNLNSRVANEAGGLWFTVDRITKLMEKDESIDSPPLYSHHNGYKLRISVILLSSGCLNVYSVICKGEYDDTLVWPARGLSVSVSLINYRTMHDYKTGTIKYDKECCNKPAGRDNPPYGRILSVRHSDLVSSTGLIVDDSILLHVTTCPP